jgi:hypothetical protein
LHAVILEFQRNSGDLGKTAQRGVCRETGIRLAGYQGTPAARLNRSAATAAGDRGFALSMETEWLGCMAELKLDHPVPMSEEEDDATLAAIDRGIQDADEGRVVSAEEARQRVQQWFSKSSIPKKR